MISLGWKLRKSAATSLILIAMQAAIKTFTLSIAHAGTSRTMRHAGY